MKTRSQQPRGVGGGHSPGTLPSRDPGSPHPPAPAPSPPLWPVQQDQGSLSGNCPFKSCQGGGWPSGAGGMRWFLPWTLAAVTAAVGSVLATVSPAWGAPRRGESSLPTVLLWGPRGRGAGVVAREVPLRGTGEEKGRGVSGTWRPEEPGVFLGDNQTVLHPPSLLK
ncbi:hypothetical protein GHT09_007456 [Marmota monax]|uniref:Uncharacterized protein n=1 Tax=Marmota monax TaxID=9995 RepID=A0A834QMX3_MARMO|nr:hypothetical protein GHT09_007456 [Marmota monax]